MKTNELIPRVLILIGLALLLTLPLVAQETSKDEVKTETPELTKEVVYQDVKAVLKDLGEALAVGAEHVYGVLVRQQIVTSIVWAAINTLIILAAFFCVASGDT